MGKLKEHFRFMLNESDVLCSDDTFNVLFEAIFCFDGELIDVFEDDFIDIFVVFRLTGSVAIFLGGLFICIYRFDQALMRED